MAHEGSYTRSLDAAATPVGDRIVLYHRVSRTALVLNPTAGWMWNRLETARTAADLASDLRQKHPSLSHADAERDVTVFLVDLARHDFVSLRQ